MNRKNIKRIFYNLMRFYKSDAIDGNKILSKIVRDSLVEIFSVRCPHTIIRDVDSIIVKYKKNTSFLEYRIKKNVNNNTCYVIQTEYLNEDIVEQCSYITHFPDDTKLFKKKVKEDTKKFNERN